MATDTVANQLLEAGSLMLVGMLVVFSFLSLLIVALRLLTWFCGRLPQEQHNYNNQIPNSESSLPASTAVPGAHVAAITAALKMHNKK